MIDMLLKQLESTCIPPNGSHSILAVSLPTSSFRLPPPHKPVLNHLSLPSFLRSPDLTRSRPPYHEPAIKIIPTPPLPIPPKEGMKEKQIEGKHSQQSPPSHSPHLLTIFFLQARQGWPGLQACSHSSSIGLYISWGGSGVGVGVAIGIPIGSRIGVGVGLAIESRIGVGVGVVIGSRIGSGIGSGIGVGIGVASGNGL